MQKLLEFKNVRGADRIEENLFFTMFQVFPSRITLYDLDTTMVIDKVKECGFKPLWTDTTLGNNYTTEGVNGVYIKGKVILEYGSYKNPTANLTFYFSNQREVEKYVEAFRGLTVPLVSKINLLTSSNGNLYLRCLDAPKIGLDLATNYGKEFLTQHEIISRFIKDDKSGLVLLHSSPGCGKSTYIQYLCNKLRKTFIFVPTNMSADLASPNFMNILADNPGAILVIEDAENFLKSRDISKNSNISDILNLSDGLLGSLLRIKIIATYNTNRENIDKALLRKGRLVCEHEFKPLSIENSLILLGKLYPDQLDFNVEKEMTLAEIYNYNTENYANLEKVSKLGFSKIA